jgi:hypothetical protein
MFKFIFNFIKLTFGALAMFVVFLIMCCVGYLIFWGVEAFFVHSVEDEWITNEYITTAIHFLFQGQYSDIIEIILIIGFGGLWVMSGDD